MESLVETLTAHGISGCDRRELYRHRRFYLGYPQIVEALSPQLVISKETVIAVKKVGTLSPQLSIPGKDLVERFSYSHFSEFLGIDDPLKRVFYEQECLRGNWSVRELQRQIATLYFERSGLSRNKKKLAALTHKKAEIGKPDFVVRDPVVYTQESRDDRICTGGNK